MASTTNNAARVPNADPATWQMARDSARRPEAPSTWEAATSRYAAALGALHDGDQADLASRVNACEAAMWRLFEAPSPDLAAFARKLEIAFAPETDLSGMLDKEAAAALMLQDLQRLVGS